MSKLSHPNVLRYHAVCIHGGRLHCLFDYIEGGSLEQLLAEPGRRLSWRVRLGLALVMWPGPWPMCTDRCAVVADFGLAIKMPRYATQRLLECVGSPFWMAPECMRGCGFSTKADVFSYGIVLCELLTRLPADPDFLPRLPDFGIDAAALESSLVPPDCPRPLLQLALSACSQEPAVRPSFADLAGALMRLLDKLEAGVAVETVRDVASTADADIEADELVEQRRLDASWQERRHQQRCWNPGMKHNPFVTVRWERNKSCLQAGRHGPALLLPTGPELRSPSGLNRAWSYPDLSQDLIEFLEIARRCRPCGEGTGVTDDSGKVGLQVAKGSPVVVWRGALVCQRPRLDSNGSTAAGRGREIGELASHFSSEHSARLQCRSQWRPQLADMAFRCTKPKTSEGLVIPVRLLSSCPSQPDLCSCSPCRHRGSSDQRNDSNGPGTQSRQGDGADRRGGDTGGGVGGFLRRCSFLRRQSGGRDSEEQLRLRIYLQTSSSSCERGAAASATDAKDVNEAKADTATAATPSHPKAGGERWRFRRGRCNSARGAGYPDSEDDSGGTSLEYELLSNSQLGEPASSTAPGADTTTVATATVTAAASAAQEAAADTGKSGHSSQSPAVKGSSALMYDGPPQSGTQKQQLHSMKDQPRSSARLEELLIQKERQQCEQRQVAELMRQQRPRQTDCQPSRGRHQRHGQPNWELRADHRGHRAGDSGEELRSERRHRHRRHRPDCQGRRRDRRDGRRARPDAADDTGDSWPPTHLIRHRLAASAAPPPPPGDAKCGRLCPRHRGVDTATPQWPPQSLPWPGCRIELSIRAGEATCFESGRLKRARAEASATLAASAAQPPACRIGPLGSGLPGRLYWPGSGGTTGTSGTVTDAQIQTEPPPPSRRAAWPPDAGGLYDSDGGRGLYSLTERLRAAPTGSAEATAADAEPQCELCRRERAHLYRRDPPPPQEATDEELRSSDGDSADSLHRQQSNAGQDGWWPEISQRRHQRHRQLFAPPSALRNGNSSDAQLGSGTGDSSGSASSSSGLSQFAEVEMAPFRPHNIPPPPPPSLPQARLPAAVGGQLGSSGSSELVELELSPADSGVHLTSRRPEPSSSGSFEIAELELSPLGGVRTTHRRAGGYGSSSSSGSSGVPAELELQLGGGGSRRTSSASRRRSSAESAHREAAAPRGFEPTYAEFEWWEREGGAGAPAWERPCADRRAPALPASAFVQRGSVRGLRRSGGGRGAPSLEDLLGRRRRRRRQSREPPCRPPPPPLPSPPPTDVIDCARGDVGWRSADSGTAWGSASWASASPSPIYDSAAGGGAVRCPALGRDGDVDGGGHSRVCSGGSGRRSGKGAAAPSSASDARSSLVVRGGSGPGSGSLQSGYSRLELRAPAARGSHQQRAAPSSRETAGSSGGTGRRSESGGETAGSGGAVAGPGTYYRFQPPPQAPVVWHKKPTATVREQTTQTSPQQQQQQQQQAEPVKAASPPAAAAEIRDTVLHADRRHSEQQQQQQQQPPASRRFSDASAAAYRQAQFDSPMPPILHATGPLGAPLVPGKTTIQLLRFHNPSAAGRAGQAPMRVRPPRFLSQQEEREAMYSRSSGLLKVVMRRGNYSNSSEINEARRRLAEATSEEEVAEAAESSGAAAPLEGELSLQRQLFKNDCRDCTAPGGHLQHSGLAAQPLMQPVRAVPPHQLRADSALQQALHVVHQLDEVAGEVAPPAVRLGLVGQRRQEQQNDIHLRVVRLVAYQLQQEQRHVADQGAGVPVHRVQAASDRLRLHQGGHVLRPGGLRRDCLQQPLRDRVHQLGQVAQPLGLLAMQDGRLAPHVLLVAEPVAPRDGPVGEQHQVRPDALGEVHDGVHLGVEAGRTARDAPHLQLRLDGLRPAVPDVGDGLLTAEALNEDQVAGDDEAGAAQAGMAVHRHAALARGKLHHLDDVQQALELHGGEVRPGEVVHRQPGRHEQRRVVGEAAVDKRLAAVRVFARLLQVHHRPDALPAASSAKRPTGSQCLQAAPPQNCRHRVSPDSPSRTALPSAVYRDSGGLPVGGKGCVSSRFSSNRQSGRPSVVWLMILGCSARRFPPSCAFGLGATRVDVHQAANEAAQVGGAGTRRPRKFGASDATAAAAESGPATSHGVLGRLADHNPLIAQAALNLAERRSSSCCRSAGPSGPSTLKRRRLQPDTKVSGRLNSIDAESVSASPSGIRSPGGRRRLQSSCWGSGQPALVRGQPLDTPNEAPVGVVVLSRAGADLQLHSLRLRLLGDQLRQALEPRRGARRARRRGARRLQPEVPQPDLRQRHSNLNFARHGRRSTPERLALACEGAADVHQVAVGAGDKSAGQAERRLQPPVLVAAGNRADPGRLQTARRHRLKADDARFPISAGLHPGVQLRVQHADPFAIVAARELHAARRIGRSDNSQKEQPGAPLAVHHLALAVDHGLEFVAQAQKKLLSLAHSTGGGCGVASEILISESSMAQASDLAVYCSALPNFITTVCTFAVPHDCSRSASRLPTMACCSERSDHQSARRPTPSYSFSTSSPTCWLASSLMTCSTRSVASSSSSKLGSLVSRTRTSVHDAFAASPQSRAHSSQPSAASYGGWNGSSRLCSTCACTISSEMKTALFLASRAAPQGALFAPGVGFFHQPQLVPIVGVERVEPLRAPPGPFWSLLPLSDGLQRARIGQLCRTVLAELGADPAAALFQPLKLFEKLRTRVSLFFAKQTVRENSLWKAGIHLVQLQLTCRTSAPLLSCFEIIWTAAAEILAFSVLIRCGRALVRRFILQLRCGRALVRRFILQLRCGRALVRRFILQLRCGRALVRRFILQLRCGRALVRRFISSSGAAERSSGALSSSSGAAERSSGALSSSSGGIENSSPVAGHSGPASRQLSKLALVKNSWTARSARSAARQRRLPEPPPELAPPSVDSRLHELRRRSPRADPPLPSVDSRRHELRRSPRADTPLLPRLCRVLKEKRASRSGITTSRSENSSDRLLVAVVHALHVAAVLVGLPELELGRVQIRASVEETLPLWLRGRLLALFLLMLLLLLLLLLSPNSGFLFSWPPLPLPLALLIAKGDSSQGRIRLSSSEQGSRGPQLRVIPEGTRDEYKEAEGGGSSGPRLLCTSLAGRPLSEGSRDSDTTERAEFESHCPREPGASVRSRDALTKTSGREAELQLVGAVVLCNPQFPIEFPGQPGGAGGACGLKGGCCPTGLDESLITCAAQAGLFGKPQVFALQLPGKKLRLSELEESLLPTGNSRAKACWFWKNAAFSAEWKPGMGNATNSMCTEHSLPETRLVAVGSLLFYSALGLLGLLGNGHVIMVFVGSVGRERSLRFLVIVLSCMDLLICGVVLPTDCYRVFTDYLASQQQEAAARQLQVRPVNHWLSSLILSSRYAAFAMEAWILVLVAVDRYLSIVRARQSGLRLRTTLVALAGGAGALLALESAATLAHYLSEDRCRVKLWVETNLLRLYGVLGAASLLAVLALYIRLFAFVAVKERRRSARREQTAGTLRALSNAAEPLAGHADGQPDAAAASGFWFPRRLALMLFAASLLFYASMLPMLLINFRLIPDSPLHRFFYLNASLNFFLYALVNDKFRAELLRLYRQRLCRAGGEVQAHFLVKGGEAHELGRVRSIFLAMASTVGFRPLPRAPGQQGSEDRNHSFALRILRFNRFCKSQLSDLSFYSAVTHHKGDEQHQSVQNPSVLTEVLQSDKNGQTVRREGQDGGCAEHASVAQAVQNAAPDAEALGRPGQRAAVPEEKAAGVQAEVHSVEDHLVQVLNVVSLVGHVTLAGELQKLFQLLVVCVSSVPASTGLLQAHLLLIQAAQLDAVQLALQTGAEAGQQ
uniref:Protein kinase domain-containing protein n=1 Tax=Macrostomum lignano TaxID=282301 RepID=A0A1I8II87_9PLAT